MRIGPKHGLDGAFDITHVIHRIENTEYINTVDGSSLDEFIHYIVRKVPVAEQVLPAHEHLLACVRHRRL